MTKEEFKAALREDIAQITDTWMGATHTRNHAAIIEARDKRIAQLDDLEFTNPKSYEAATDQDIRSFAGAVLQPIRAIAFPESIGFEGKPSGVESIQAASKVLDKPIAIVPDFTDPGKGRFSKFVSGIALPVAAAVTLGTIGAASAAGAGAGGGTAVGTAGTAGAGVGGTGATLTGTQFAGQIAAAEGLGLGTAGATAAGATAGTTVASAGTGILGFLNNPLVQAGAGIIGAGLSARATTKGAEAAAAAQLQAAREGIEFQTNALERAISLQEPFRQGGLAAFQQLGGAAGSLRERAFSPETDPLFKFQKGQLAKSLAARGITESGRGIQEEVGLSASEALRRENLITQSNQILQNLSAIGSGTAAGVGQQIGATGANLANIAIGGGQAQAQALQTAAQTRASLFSGAGGLPLEISALQQQQQGSRDTQQLLRLLAGGRK